MTTHEHEHKHEHAHTRETTPPQSKADIATAARTLVAAAERLGPRITAHAPGCPANAAGPCICGSVDFLNAMEALKAALLALP